MTKFLAVVKHEYKKVVLKWSFLIGTLLFPLIGAMFIIVPGIIFSLQGDPTRLVIVDRNGNVGDRLKQNLAPEKLSERSKKAATESITNPTTDQSEQLQRAAEQLGSAFVFVEHDIAGKTDEAVINELNAKIREDVIDAYLLIPADINSADSKFRFYSRKAGDFVGNTALKDALNRSVRTQRMAEANIDEARLNDLTREVDFEASGITETGETRDSESTLIVGFIIGFMIYLTLTIYGQSIMGAVVEEKETRIAEILFSSARPFELMFGKLVGVGLAGLTQLAIWIISAAVVLGVGVSQMEAAGMSLQLPSISPLLVIYFCIYFLLGYFIYASIFALIGSMVTTMQEGGQFSFPPILILLIGFYLSFAVIRDPNSSVAVWSSIAPFFAPITMPVRMMGEMPPFWQVALSIGVNILAIAGLVWIASRVYRVGMLMYGKRATLPEVWKWIQQK